MSLFGAIALFAAISMFCVMQALYWALRRRRSAREQDLQRRLRGNEYDANEDLAGLSEQDGWLDRLASVQSLGRVLAQAGVAGGAPRFIMVWASAIAFLMGLLSVTRGVGSAVVAAAFAVVVIYFVISNRRRARLDAIDEQLPQALELISFSLRAGHTLEQAIGFVTKELSEPLATELSRVHEEYELGRPLQNALLNLSLRLAPCRALRTFVEAVLVLKQTGGNLVEIIENLIVTLRAQAAYEARYRALTAEGRTSGMILGALPLLILVAVTVFEPGYLGALFRESGGHWVLIIALGLWSLGIAWLVKLLRPVV